MKQKQTLYTLFIVITFCCWASHAIDRILYLEERETLLDNTFSRRFDRHTFLSPKEINCQAHMLSAKQRYISHMDSEFILSRNFRDVKGELESLPFYDWIKSMPKGGLLHVHSVFDSMVGIRVGTYRSDCYVNMGNGNERYARYSFIYASEGALPSGSGIRWENIVELRNQSADRDEFDRELWYNTTQFITPPSDVKNDDMWDYFDGLLGSLGTLYSNEDVWRKSLKESLLMYWEDGVSHIEIRDFMNWIVDDAGNQVYNTSGITELWIEVLNGFICCIV
eukprot:TRINITY_DN901_c0_g3_i1.p1 TRINITY_DN901_c0_g3~~TRINITY_DN901_c0_g3_i1.p1  ORF type:complete len:280 (+),score=45.80 TRINITY_DN901_c0_g3_i1:21-860(+)